MESTTLIVFLICGIAVLLALWWVRIRSYERRIDELLDENTLLTRKLREAETRDDKVAR